MLGVGPVRIPATARHGTLKGSIQSAFIELLDRVSEYYGGNPIFRNWLKNNAIDDIYSATRTYCMKVRARESQL